jgi:hypothetical protein
MLIGKLKTHPVRSRAVNRLQEIFPDMNCVLRILLNECRGDGSSLREGMC